MLSEEGFKQLEDWQNHRKSFNIKDKKKEREIQRQTKNIETLGKAYDELKEKMEAA